MLCWAQTVSWDAFQEEGGLLLLGFSLLLLEVFQKLIPLVFGRIAAKIFVYLWVQVHIELGFDEKELVFWKCDPGSSERRLNTPDPGVDVFLVECGEFHLFYAAAGVLVGGVDIGRWRRSCGNQFPCGGLCGGRRYPDDVVNRKVRHVVGRSERPGGVELTVLRQGRSYDGREVEYSWRGRAWRPRANQTGATERVLRELKVSTLVSC